MSFTNEVLDLPARMGSYRDAGYSQTDAKRLAYADLKNEAYKILEEEEVAVPIDVELQMVEPIFIETNEEVVNDHKFQIASETNAIVDACARHNIGISDRNYKVLAAIQNHLLCQPNASGTMPKLEAIHSESISPKQLTLHMEDASSFSLKEMWRKLKESFKKGFERIRTWYLKAFDSCSRLGKKAAAVKASLESKQGSINNQTIEFSGLNTLNIDGKVPDANGLTELIGQMSGTTQNILGKSADFYTKIVEQLKGALQEMAKNMPQRNDQQGNDTTTDFTTNSGNNPVFSTIVQEFDNVQRLMGGDSALEEWTNASTDERFKSLAESGNATLYKSRNPLPGNKMLVISIPNYNANQISNDLLKDIKSSFGITVEDIEPKKNGQQNPADKAQFQTLNSSQITKICDWVMESCTVGLNYRQQFGNRDKVYKDLESELDRTVNQSSNLQGAAMTHVRTNVSAVSTIFNKINNGEGRWFRYAMTVFAKMIDYAQASSSQIS